MATTTPSNAPLVRFQASPVGPKSPFGNDIEFELSSGSCVCLVGNSGAGKTTLAMHLAGLSSARYLQTRLDIFATTEWDSTIPKGERCGVLFQQTTLLDELTVAGNLQVALQARKTTDEELNNNNNNSMMRVKQCMEAVGLDYARDASKRPTELSGGMARRASLALQLAQRKRVIVLDEPFTGLDPDSAASVAKELVRLRQTHGCALLLISHEPHLTQLVMEDNNNNNKKNTTIRLEPPKIHTTNGKDNSHDHKATMKRPNLFGTTLWQRFLDKLVDYVLWSLPLILLTFAACGLAIAMLSSDILRRIDVTDRVLDIVDTEVRPLLKMVLGEGADANPFTMMAIKMKVRGMLNSTVPQAKATLYALGMAKLFCLEVGPLLTALLLCGRIGGSYAGKVATMQATSQTKLLQTLGINPQMWSLVPSMAAALLASPFLTAIGTYLALVLGGMVGPRYGISTVESYWENVWDAVLPPLRLRSIQPLWEEVVVDMGNNVTETRPATSPWEALWTHQDLRPTFSDTYTDSLIEVATYPVVYHLTKAVVFIAITMLVSETCARLRPNLTPRNVPSVITSSVVLSSLLVIVADWGFSQLWLLRF